MTDLQRRLTDALAERYRVLRELGQGGMAVVFLAEDMKHGRQVALKVFRPELGAAMGAERFLREIEIAAQLNHPNILPLHDSGEADGLLYFVMPFLDGESLRDRLDRDGTLPLDEAVAITAEVADALDYAHAQGLVHRDIKPENILFQAGHALVTDFGIAKALTDAAGQGLTRTGLAIGTVTYMSPEQASGEGSVDARSDQYALGCVLYEMLAGRPPFSAAGVPAMLAQKVMAEVPPIGADGSTVPRTVDTVLRRALAPEPDHRFGSAGELATELRRTTTEFAVAADSHRRRRTRNLRRLATAAMIVALGAVGWWLTAIIGGTSPTRIAVLPITTPTNDPDEEFFVAGIHDALITELGLAGVTVIGRQSVMRYRGVDTPTRVIADELGVDVLVEASALRMGDSVALQVRLVDGESEEQLWAASYGEEMRDVLAIYRGATRAIADEIHLALTPQAEERLQEAPQVDPEVYLALLQGEFHWGQLTEESLTTALRYYQLALERDPDNAMAHAGIARTYGGQMQMGLLSSAEGIPLAMPAAERALQLDSTLADVHFMVASTIHWWGWNWDEMARGLARSVELDPTDARKRAYYAHHLGVFGRHEESLAQMEIAVRTDPLDPLILGIQAMELNFARRYEEARVVLTNALARHPNVPILKSTLRTTYHLTGQHAEAIEIWKQSYEGLGNQEAASAVQRGWEQGGYSAALRAAAETLEAQSATGYVTPWQIGTLYTRAGEVEQAILYLQRAFEARDANVPYLGVDPIFDPLRADPRFVEMIRQLDLPT